MEATVGDRKNAQAKEIVPGSVRTAAPFVLLERLMLPCTFSMYIVPDMVLAAPAISHSEPPCK